MRQSDAGKESVMKPKMGKGRRGGINSVGEMKAARRRFLSTPCSMGGRPIAA
jgi:hypothetical protein